MAMPNLWDVPDDFFKAVKAVAAFSKNSIVGFDEIGAYSHDNDNETAIYTIETLAAGMSFNPKYLLLVEHALKKADFDKETNKVYFFGDKCRGILSCVTQGEE